jgi:hypothetical protein
MGAVVPVDVIDLEQSQIRLVNERCRLDGVARAAALPPVKPRQPM